MGEYDISLCLVPGEHYEDIEISVPTGYELPSFVEEIGYEEELDDSGNVESLHVGIDDLYDVLEALLDVDSL